MKSLVAGIVVAGVLTVAFAIPAHASINAATHQSSSSSTPSASDIIATAKAHLGDSYATIGNSPATGFSCIGFVNYVFAQHGVNVPFDIPAAWNSAPHVAINELMPGDVLFFSNTVFAGLSHVAIYIGNGEMIGADNFSVGVTTDRLGDSYWTQHYTGATRPLALVGAVPLPGSGTTAPSPTATATPSPQAANSSPTVTATPSPSPDRGYTDQPVTATSTPSPVRPLAAVAPSGTMLQPVMAEVGLYSGPGYSYTPMSTLDSSSVLTVLFGQGGWYNVRTGNIYGWVDASEVGPAGRDQTRAPNMPPVGPATPELSPTPAATPAQEFSNAVAVSTPAGDSILYVAQGPLKIRSGPGKSFSQIGYLLVGTRLVVHETQQGWAHATTPAGVTGWMAQQYLSQTAPARYSRASSTGGPAIQSPGMTVRVATSVLNVRMQPNSHARVITVLFPGEAVQVLALQTGWDQVKLHDGTTGWASAAWLADQARCRDEAGTCSRRDR